MCWPAVLRWRCGSAAGSPAERAAPVRSVCLCRGPANNVQVVCPCPALEHSASKMGSRCAGWGFITAFRCALR